MRIKGFFYIIISIPFLLGFGYLRTVEDFKQQESADAKPGLIAELKSLKVEYNDWMLRAEFCAKVEALLKESDGNLYHNPEKLARLILAKSEEHNIDPVLILAVIRTESNFQRFAVSHKGAVGLMQLLPPTASYVADKANVAYYHEGNLYDSRKNIALGTYYLSKLLQQFGNVRLALEAYNRGPASISKDLKRRKRIKYYYADKVLHHYREYSNAIISL
ncbi:MAG: lytic transglycosylase domain-containing protein [Nitrospinota bacterium]|nr:lytic transglycosylase domain-containing protein [Nitrospinota bacterium]